MNNLNDDQFGDYTKHYRGWLDALINGKESEHGQ